MIYEVSYEDYMSKYRYMNVIPSSATGDGKNSVYFIVRGVNAIDSMLFKDKRVLSLDFLLGTLDEVSTYKDLFFDVPVNLHLYVDCGYDYNLLAIDKGRCRLVVHVQPTVVLDMQLIEFMQCVDNILFVGGDFVFVDGVRYGSLYGIRDSLAYSNNGYDETFYGNNYKVVLGETFTTTTVRSKDSTGVIGRGQRKAGSRVSETATENSVSPKSVSYFKRAFLEGLRANEF